MSRRYPLTRYRPTRVPDSAGGFDERLGTGLTIYATLEIQAAKVEALVDAYEDVKVGDIVEDDTGAKYRVTDTRGLPGSGARRLGLERMEHPITP
jgi:hypothetical protein